MDMRLNSAYEINISLYKTFNDLHLLDYLLIFKRRQLPPRGVKVHVFTTRGMIVIIRIISNTNEMSRTDLNLHVSAMCLFNKRSVGTVFAIQCLRTGLGWDRVSVTFLYQCDRKLLNS